MASDPSEQRSSPQSGAIEQVGDQINLLSARLRTSFFNDSITMKGIPEDGSSGNPAGTDEVTDSSKLLTGNKLEKLEKMLEDINGQLQQRQDQDAPGGVTARARWANVRERAGASMDWLALRPGQDEEDAEKGRLGLLDEEEFKESIEEIEALPAAAPGGENDSFGPAMNAVKFTNRMKHGTEHRRGSTGAVLAARLGLGRRSSNAGGRNSTGDAPPKKAAARGGPPKHAGGAESAHKHACGKGRRTSFNSAVKGQSSGNDDVNEHYDDRVDVPATLEDFVDEMLSKGAAEQRENDRRIAYDLKKLDATMWARLYPLLEPGSWQKDLWDWVLALTILPTVLVYPLLLGFSDYLSGLLPMLLAFDALYW